MKLRNLVATLAAAALFPAIAHADPVSDSFDRSLFAGYFVESSTAAADPLEAWSGPVYPATGQTGVIDPQDVWSGAVDYPYSGVILADTVDPQDVWRGAAYPYAGVKQADRVDPQDAWSGIYEPAVHAAAVAGALHAKSGIGSDRHGS